MIRLVCIALIGYVTLSCAHARVVEVQPGRSGVIALKKGWDGDGRDKAETIMRRNCRKGYTVTKEGEAVVGSRSRKGASATSITDVLIGTNDEVETRDSTEWRIYYRCKGR